MIIMPPVLVLNRRLQQKYREKKVRIYEVGISYFGRTYEDGKKIGARDGFRAIYCIIKYGLFKA